MKRHLSNIRATAILACGLLTLGLWSSAYAASAALPPRPTPAPIAIPAPRYGGLIVLTIDAPVSGLWTTVEWQDALGGWHLVEGWQGILDEGDVKVWWVAPEDFGKGPFRWVVYQARGGPVWGTSASFFLPERSQTKVEVNILSSSD